MSSINKWAANVAEELNKSNENSKTGNEDIQHINKMRNVLNKNGKQSNSWPEYLKYGQTAYQIFLSIRDPKAENKSEIIAE